MAAPSPSWRGQWGAGLSLGSALIWGGKPRAAPGAGLDLGLTGGGETGAVALPLSSAAGNAEFRAWSLSAGTPHQLEGTTLRRNDQGRPGALLSPPQNPTEAEEQAGQWAQEVGQADTVCRAALGPRLVRSVKEIGVVEGLWMSDNDNRPRLCAERFLAINTVTLTITPSGRE